MDHLTSRLERRLARYKNADAYEAWQISRIARACYGGKSAPAPNYAPLAEASKESAEIMAALGRDQLNFAKQQYQDSLPLFQDLVAQQLEIGNSSKAQADDYYNYMVANQRPVEAALNADAMAAGSEAAQEAAAGKAIADARTGYTGALMTAARTGARFGYDPAKIAATAGGTGLSSASMQAAAANDAREKEKALGFAKKMDVAGLYRGLPGASSGAYGMALNAGNSAGANQMQPGNTYRAGMAAGASTIGAGRQMYQSGLQGVLNAQTSVYNASQDSGLDVGGLLGGAAKLYTAFGSRSDRRLKENIEEVGRDQRTGLTLYHFNYIGDPDTRFQGVMADEAERFMPAAIITTQSGLKYVNYDMLGIEFKEVSPCA